LKLLGQRGLHVVNQKLDKIKEIDVIINHIKENKHHIITRPVAAFITFETQEGYERACNIKGKRNWKLEVSVDKEFLGQPLYFTEAPEPTNIIWEHRDRTLKS
jgi:hypothetical protein